MRTCFCTYLINKSSLYVLLRGWPMAKRIVGIYVGKEYVTLIRLFVFCLTILFLFFLSFSLMHFDPSDFSILHNIYPYNFKTSSCVGFVSSYCASLLLYFFGMSSYFFLGALWGALIFFGVLGWYTYYYERIVGSCLFICSYSLFSYLYFGSDVPLYLTGGVLGEKVAYLFDFFLGSSLSFLGAFVVLWISMILIFQFSFLNVVRRALVIGDYLVGLFSPYFLWVIRKIFAIFYQGWEWGVILLQRGLGKFGFPVIGSQIPIEDDPYRDPFWQDILGDANSEHTPMQAVLTEIDSVLSNSTSIDLSGVGCAQQVGVSKAELYGKSIGEKPECIIPYQLPKLEKFLWHDTVEHKTIDREKEKKQTYILEEKLQRFGVTGRVVSIRRGPVVTLYEYQPDINIKISKITSLDDDLALALQALTIRMIAPIPGTSLVGFEVANKEREIVPFSSIVHHDIFRKSSARIPLILGVDPVGNSVVIDLIKMPHLLVAGSTGSGKSMQLNVILASLLSSCSPDDLKLILIDPKRLEFATFADIPHLLVPIVTQPSRASAVLKWVVKTMEERYELLARAGVRTLQEYYKLRENNKDQWEHLPYIVVIIDELADLMMTAGKDVEDLIVRIAQMARAAGIHAIVATQRPSVDIITGLIKVNFPSRISFRVVSKVDSRTILDSSGAEKLLGAGDMLFLDAHSSGIRRVHGAYIAHEDIVALADHVRLQQAPSYVDIEIHNGENSEINSIAHEDIELYESVRLFVDTLDEVSISLLQRKFRIGFNRSARMIELLESQGHIISSDGGKMRKVVRKLLES